jgi:signal transduction histidine kinase
MAEVDRLSQMVDELLVLSRAGEHDRPGTDVDLAEAADRALERWRKAADDSGVELVRMRRDGPSSVWCTVGDLDRALDALIENAIRYSPPDSRVAIVNGRRTIEIVDHGPGLEPGEEEAVFERFHRGRAGRQGVPGTGLGLPIARELVEQWGGTVTIANRDGRGARAAIAWPQGGPLSDLHRRGGG